MPSSHLILCHPLLLLHPIPPRIRDFSNESTVLMRWPKYWSFSFSIIPSKEYPGMISSRMDWLDLLAVQGTLKSLLQHHSPKSINPLELSLLHSPTLMSIELVLPSYHLILCCPLLLLPWIFPSIRVFSSESVLCIRWPKYWSFKFSTSPSKEYSGFPLGWTGWISLQSKGLSRISSSTAVQKLQFFHVQLYGPTLTTIHDYWKNHSFD